MALYVNKYNITYLVYAVFLFYFCSLLFKYCTLERVAKELHSSCGHWNSRSSGFSIHCRQISKQCRGMDCYLWESFYLKHNWYFSWKCRWNDVVIKANSRCWSGCTINDWDSWHVKTADIVQSHAEKLRLFHDWYQQ